jgi:Fe-S-cluster containining protein
VHDGPAGLADVVPIAWKLCDEITRVTVDRCRLAGKCIPCKRGCSACCRYLVPLSVPEVLHLWRDIGALSQLERIELLARFHDVALRVIQAARANPPVTRADAEEASDDVILSAAGRWYRKLRLDCPLLAGDACRFYDRRPLACRAYFVVSDPHYCRQPDSGLGERLAVPVSPVQALCRLAAELEQTAPEAVLLPLAPMWALENLRRAKRTWPLSLMVRRLVEILTEQAAQTATAAGAEIATPKQMAS